MIAEKLNWHLRFRRSDAMRFGADSDLGKLSRIAPARLPESEIARDSDNDSAGRLAATALP